MKSNIPELQTLTLDQLEEKLLGIDTRITEQEAERTRLQDSLPYLVVTDAGCELAGMRERKLIAELGDEIRILRQGRELLETLITEARQRKALEGWEERIAQSKRLALVVHDKAATLHGALVRVVALAAELRKADEVFVASLPGRHPSGFDSGSLSITLMRRIEVALYCLSDGALRPRQLFDSPHQMRESGHADISAVAKEYTGIGLKRSPPRFDGPRDAA